MTVAKPFALALVAVGAMAAPAIAADVADTPSCLKSPTLASATQAVTTDTLVAQASMPRFSDPACTYRVPRPQPQPPIFEEPVRGLW